MDSQITSELVVSPRGASVQVEPVDVRGQIAYAAELRSVLERVITASGVDVLEVGDLIVNQPLPEKYSRLRNGLEIETAEAVDLAVGMAVGDGPYCRLSKEGRLRVETGWDGNMHLYMTSRLANDLTGLHGRELSLDWCTAAPEPVDAPRLVDAAADDRFWATVQAATKSVILLCERWAYGAYGCRWFRVTPENAAEIAYAVRPRSLLCVVADPDLRIEPALLDDDFTSFKAPLSPGELAYRAYPFGADDLSEVTAEGFSLMLRESELSKWCAVVPDSDGVVRGQWEDYGES